MRRALEEADPEVETFSAAGYFGVAVDYKGIDDPHSASYCPVVIKPQHAVREQPKAEDRDLHEKRRWRRRLMGMLRRSAYTSSRTLMRGWLSTAALGVLSAVPLIGHLLAPRRYAQLRAWMNKAFLPEPRTELTLMRNTAESHSAMTGLLTGFAPAEKAERVASVLMPAGLTRGFARLVVILGHGSTSLNNPHESAHDCGACGGRRGGPNARLFAAMANRAEVRERLRERGIDIPRDTWFVGGYHDTCNDDVELYDLDSVPAMLAGRCQVDSSPLWTRRGRATRRNARGGSNRVLPMPRRRARCAMSKSAVNIWQNLGQSTVIAQMLYALSGGAALRVACFWTAARFWRPTTLHKTPTVSASGPCWAQ